MNHVVFIKPHSNSSLRMNKMISGSQALVVGGTSGIGYAIAKRLATSPNYQFSAITIVGRTKPTTMPENLSFRAVDASSMKALKDFARDFRSQDQKLDLLVMTQGILTMAGRTETPEGIDKKMALHFYGKQLLIRELGPIMSPDAKVMIVLDGKNGDAKRLNWEDLDLKNTFSLATAANHCITMSDAMVQHHAVSQSDGNKRFFTHAYPGVVDTATAKNSAWYFRALSKVVSTIAGSTPDECAERLLDGMYARAEEEAGKDVFWSCIDNHGKKIEGKKVWTAEEREKIASHTWAIVDGN